MLKEIRFYQIPFSHFCEKVRWALDFYGLKYQSINYSRRRPEGLRRAPKDLQKLVPIIEVPNEGAKFVSDSTPILIYLENHYSNDHRHLFPLTDSTEKDQIIQYCLKLDSSLGLYARRLAYLKIISEKPSLVSVLVDGKYDRTDFDSLSSSFLGFLGSLIIIGRFALYRIDEDQILLRTIEVLDQIQRDLEGKEFLFSNQFTAADLTLVSLIYPLTLSSSLMQRYATIFEYSHRIRKQFDPKPFQPSVIEQHLIRERKPPAFAKVVWFHLLSFLVYPLKFIVETDDRSILEVQYPSTNIQEKANNDNRILPFNSIRQTLTFCLKSIFHYFVTLPKQMRLINQKSEQVFRQPF